MSRKRIDPDFYDLPPEEIERISSHIAWLKRSMADASRRRVAKREAKKQSPYYEWLKVCESVGSMLPLAERILAGETLKAVGADFGVVGATVTDRLMNTLLMNLPTALFEKLTLEGPNMKARLRVAVPYWNDKAASGTDLFKVKRWGSV